MARRRGNVSRMPERSEDEVPVRGGGWPGSPFRNELSRLFGGLGGRDVAEARDPFELFDWALGGAVTSFGHSDFSETDNGYELQIDLPGMSKDDVSIDYRNGAVTISGERTDEREDKRRGYYISERSYGSFQRTFRIPEDVNPDNIKAEFKNGVLTVTLPKSEEAQRSARRIDVSG